MKPKESISIELRYEADSILLSATEKGLPSLPISSWPSFIVSRLSGATQWFAISELWSSEILKELRPGVFAIEYESYHELSPELRSSLGIPGPEPVNVQLETLSNAGDAKFDIDCRITHQSHGRLDQAHPRKGPAFVIDPRTVVFVDDDVRKLVELTDAWNPGSGTIGERLEFLASAKDLASKSGASIDLYMQRESLDSIEIVTIEPAVLSPTEVQLNPKLRTNTGDLVESPRPSPPNVITRRDGKSRHRHVISKLAKMKYEGVSRNAEIKGADVPRLITNPEAFVPEGIDLSLYSDRVKDLKVEVYNSRPYVHVRKSSGGWLEAAVEIELENVRESPDAEADKSSSTPRISPGTLRKLIESSEEPDPDWVLDRHSRWVAVGKRERSFAEAIPVDWKRGEYKPVQGVLRILENLDLLEYIHGDPDVLSEIRRKHIVPDLAPPACFNGTLFEHQQFGYRWLGSLEAEGLGGLLADDMGLGKTIQILAHLGRLFEKGKLRPALIVLPLTLMDNWEREARKFLGRQITIHRHEGTRDARMYGLQRGADLVLISYDTLRRDQLELAKIDWRVVICDEAQYVKNPTAQRTSVVKALKAEHRVALTGTPVENGLVEFWCIMDFVQPGLLRSWSEFRSAYERPIIDAAEKDRQALVEKLQHEIAPHYVRRLKSDLAEKLPPKQICVEHVSLCDAQIREYRSIARTARDEGPGAALAAIGKLLHLSSAPPSECMASSIDVQIQSCPKLSWTLDRVGEIRERGEKVAVFTRFLALQRLLQEAIQHRFGLYPDCINGSITKRRQDIIDIFGAKEGFNAIVLSHDVAGVGLNVTAANHVIHYTRPWNPAKENQASDRVHRIGQDKPVTVHVPVAGHPQFETVDSKLDALLAEKADLARDVLVPRADWTVATSELLDCLNA